MKKLTYLLIALMSLSIASAQDISFTFENAQITNDGTNDFYEVDVMVSSSANLKVGTGQFYINYNTTAFGDFVESSGTGVFESTSGILNNEFWNLVYTDNSISRVSYAYAQLAPESDYTSAQTTTTTPKTFTHLKIQYLSGQTGADPAICFESDSGFTDLNFTACGGSFGADCNRFPGVRITDDTFDCSGAALPVCLGTTTYTSSGWENGTPDATTEAIFQDSYDSANGNITACQIVVQDGATLTIGMGEYIEVQDNITVETGGSILVAHQGSIVQINDDAVVTNNGIINVNVTTPIIKPRDFMVISSPMTSETRVGVFTDAFRVLNHSTSNFVPHPDVTAQFPMAENFADDNGNDWTSHSGLITPAEGYLVYPQPDISSGNTSYDLTYNLGTLNNGVVSYNVEFNTDKNASPNVIGNPYASAISATDFINANAMVDEVFFWEHITTPNIFPGYNSANFSMEDISMRNLAGGVAAASDPGTTTQPNDFISSGQGFGIKATAAGTAVFNNSMRRTSGNNTLRLSGDTDRIWLKLSNQQYEMQGSTLIGFSESTSQQLDQGYDSRRLASIVSLYSHLENGSQELGIQSREAFESSIEIPMGFSTMIDSELYYNISITDVQGINIETATVYLIDNELQVTTNLSKQDYEFTSVKGTFNNRFTLKFEKDIVLDTADNVLFQDSISIYPNPAADYITIGNPNQLELVNAAIYDLTGRLIQQIDLSDISSSKTIDISNLNTATYIIAIKGIKGKVVKRILKQ